jgi:hypothetical protein
MIGDGKRVKLHVNISIYKITSSINVQQLFNTSSLSLNVNLVQFNSQITINIQDLNTHLIWSHRLNFLPRPQNTPPPKVLPCGVVCWMSRGRLRLLLAPIHDYSHCIIRLRFVELWSGLPSQNKQYYLKF